MIPRFSLYNVAKVVSDNFISLDRFFRSEQIFRFDWSFFSFETPGAVTNYRIPHLAKFNPTDVMTTMATGAITFHYELFDDTFIYITTSGAVKFRGMLGKYKEITS